MFHHLSTLFREGSFGQAHEEKHFGDNFKSDKSNWMTSSKTLKPDASIPLMVDSRWVFGFQLLWNKKSMVENSYGLENSLVLVWSLVFQTLMPCWNNMHYPDTTI